MAVMLAVRLAVTAGLITAPQVVAGFGPGRPGPLELLERELAGVMTPFLGSQHGSFYMAGQSVAATNPVTSVWPVKENETIGCGP